MLYDYVLWAVILGDERVGKSAILSKFSSNIFTDAYKPTPGVTRVDKQIQIQNMTISIQVFDVVSYN